MTMSEKDSVSGQGTPALLHALGTLALAAATALAIKWYISRDKTENAEDKESKFQLNQEDGQTPKDNPKTDEEMLENDIKDSQVSDEQGKTASAFDYFSHGTLKSALDTSWPNSAYVKEDREYLTDHKRLLGSVAPVFCRLNNVAGPENTLHNSEEENISISGLPAAIEDDKTNDAQNQGLSTCFTQIYDKTAHERSQKEQLDTGIGSSNGECIDGMNVTYLGCKSQPIVDDNILSGICSEHKTVNGGWDEDLINMNNCEINENVDYDTEANIVNHTKPCVESNDMSASISGKNIEENTQEDLNERVNHMCAPGLPESQKSVNIRSPISPFYKSVRTSIPASHEVLTRCHKQQTSYTVFNMQDILGAVDVIQETKQTNITISNEDTVLTNMFWKSHSQDEKLNFKPNNHITCAQKTSMKRKIYETTEDVIEEATGNEKTSSMNSIVVSKEHMAIEEKKGQLLSSDNTLHNCHNGKHDTELLSRDKQINGGSQKHMELLWLHKTDTIEEKIKNTVPHRTNHVLQWNTTTVYNSAEYIDLLYPLGFHAPENVITPFIEQDKGQSYIESTDSLVTEKSMSVCNERNYNNLDTDVASSFERSTSHNITYNKIAQSSMTRKILCDLSNLNPFNSMMITKTEIQSIKSTSNEQDNNVIYNWHKHDANFLTMDKKEFCAIITNGYFSRYRKQVDANRFGCSSENYKQESYDNNQQSAISKPLSNFLQNPVRLPEGSSVWSPISSIDNHTASSITMDLFKSEAKCSQTFQEIKKDHDFSEDQESDSLWSFDENLGLINLDNTDPRFNAASPGQGPFTCSTSSTLHNEEQDQSLQNTDQERLDSADSNVLSSSRKMIMSTIAETPELILPEYQSAFIPESKTPLITKSCDNIYSGPSYKGSALKAKAQSMLCLLTEYYTTKLHSLENGPLEEVARGCFIRIPKGFHNIREGVRFQLTLGNCLELLRLARKNSVPELLKAIYTLISDNYLNVLKNSAIYSQLTGLEREKILQLRMRGKLSLCIIEAQSIFGLNKNSSQPEDMSQDQPKDQLYSLDMESSQWRPVTNIPEEACLKGCSICSMHNYLFIAGGIQKTKNGALCSNKLFCYNPLTDIWTQLTPMNQARSQLKLVPLDGYLYAIGGECLQTMERYDPRSNKWTFVASLPRGSFAVAHEAAACGGEIYISGGHLFYRLLKYNPARNLWEECPFNASKGRSCDMVAVGHILYRFDMHKDSAVHIFKYNTTAMVWSEYTTTFPSSKVPFRCAVLDGTIYCLNRETTARFSLEEEKAIFESATFSKVPTKGIGFPCPVVLSLQGSLSQTSV